MLGSSGERRDPPKKLVPDPGSSEKGRCSGEEGSTGEVLRAAGGWGEPRNGQEGKEIQWRQGVDVAGWEGQDTRRTGTRSRVVKGRDEGHGGKRIGLARKMEEHKEDNGARCCYEQRVRSEQWPSGRQTHVQKQKTRGSSCLWLLGTVFGCLQSKVIDYS